MSVENIKAFNEKINASADLQKKFKETGGDAEKYIALAKENGFEISKADIEAYKESLKPEGELSEEQLSDVAGGFVRSISVSIL